MSPFLSEPLAPSPVFAGMPTESPVHRYVEQSNLLMEQRNHSLQTTNENTQARVLHAEQEKVMVA